MLRLLPNTPAWRAWRFDGIGASDSPALLGCSPYKTARQLYHEKVTRKSLPVTGPHISRGHRVEALVRSAYERATRRRFAPAFVEHPVHRCIRASLDGWDPIQGEGIEIKYVGAAAYAAAAVPPHHYVQMQHQMLVKGATRWTYLISTDGRAYKTITVYADPEMQARILGACLEFWSRVQRQEPPDYGDQDWVAVQNPKLHRLLMAWALSGVKQVRQAVLKEASFHGHQRIICAGFKVSLATGRVTPPRGAWSPLFHVQHGYPRALGAL